MVILIQFFLTTMTLAVSPSSADQADPGQLKDKINAEFAEQKGSIALAYKDLQTGERTRIS